jgi:hypothetical protein
MKTTTEKNLEMSSTQLGVANFGVEVEDGPKSNNLISVKPPVRRIRLHRNHNVTSVGTKSTSDIINEMEAGEFNFMYKIELNRELSTSHVNQLAKEIFGLYKIIGDKSVAQLYCVKRTVNGRQIIYVLDGQHRVQACINILKVHQIDIRLSYVLLDGDILSNSELVEIITTFNSSSLKWKNITYVELFSKMKTPGYSKFLELLKQKDNKYHATNLAHLYTGSQKGLKLIKKGMKLDVTEGNKRKDMFDEIVALLPEYAKNTKILRAITNMLLLPEYKHSNFIPKFTVFSDVNVRTNNFPKTEEDFSNVLSTLIV